jgi:hypothetical protein
MQASAVYRLRQALRLDPPKTPVKVIDPFQMLGEIKPDLLDAIGADVVCLESPTTMFGFRKENWKEWELFDGTPVLVPGSFNTEPEADGAILQYPEGDKECQPSGIMPEGGYYFDVIVRQPPIIEEELALEDNLADFQPVSNDVLAYYKHEADKLYKSGRAILAQFGGSDFGNAALVPGAWLKNPKGIRAIDEWYVSPLIRKDFVMAVFDRQCQLAIENLEKIYQVVGDKITAIMITGTDFGAQQGPLISPKVYREVFFPFHKKMCDWVHRYTNWHTFVHSCGSIVRFIPDFIEAGYEILNPVQTSCRSMDPQQLKTQFGDQLTFWGGGVDTQHTLPFGTPDDVKREVRQRLQTFGPGGGFVFNPIHNVQGNVPIENILAMYNAVQTFGKY